MKNVLFLSSLLMVLFISGCTKNDNNSPTTIPNTIICSKVWMTKNLDVANYRNGDPIPKVTDNAAWAALTTGAYCYYNNDSATYAATYGKLYNWFAVNDPRGLAPIGWHVPSVLEWTTLATCLGGEDVVGCKMKESGTTHWLSPNSEATNSSGFNALPGGGRYYSGSCVNIGDTGFWWSSTEDVNTNPWYFSLNTNNCSLNTNYFNKPVGFSVRCVKD